jgi:large subunit ribosomal protein L32
MTAPKKRTTKSRRDKRRLHIHLKESSLTKCPKCDESILPHHVCPFCGFYKGKQVLNTNQDKENKKEEKAQVLDLKKLSKK